MRRDTIERLIDAASSLNFEAEICEDYSGRGMFGKTTTGMTLPDLDKLAAIAAVVTRDAIEVGEDTGDFINDLLRLKTDNLGRGYIVY